MKKILLFSFLFTAIFLTTSANAARIITSVTLNGASNVTVGPSASIATVVNVTTNNGGGSQRWQSTSWSIGGSTPVCVNHTDYSSSASYSETFNMLAPATSGTFNASFIAYSDNGCSQGASSTYTRTNGVIVSTIPIADYHFDECSWNGTTAEVRDSSPSALHGKSVNGANTGVGKVYTSGQFDGTNDHLDFGNVLNPASSSWSISVWFKWDGSTGDNIIYNKENLYEARVSGGYFQYAWMPHWAWDGGTNFPVTANTWYHAVITYDGTTQKVYKNGVQVYTRAQTGAIGTNTNKLLLGARGSSTPGSFFGGNIDEAKIFSHALTLTEIQSIYTNESSGNNYDGTSHTVPSCGTPTLSTCGTEDFSQYTVTAPFTTNWTIIKNENYTPAVVNGRLMLTDLTTNVATGVTLNGSLPASNNYLEITFQSFAYGGTGADGITLTLSDAAIVPVAGAFGGSLGYAQKPGINGFAGGWLGFGLDEYGNFSNPADGGKSGGPGAVVDSVAIRGSGSGTTGYSYIAGTATLSPEIDQATEGPGYWYRMSIDTRNASTLVKVERNTNINGTGSYSPLIDWTNATQVAAAPANYRLSLTGSTGSSTNYHTADNFILKAMSCGTVTVIPPTLSGRFDAWDSFRSINDRNISTKIVGKDFNLTIASLNSTNSALQDFNGTVCARMVNSSGTAISSWNPPLLFNNQQTKVTTFNLNRAIGSADYAKLDLHWKTNATDICPLSSETNNTIASDYFSVRPNGFTLSAPNAVAGTDFNITFSAPNFSTTASAEYNETVQNSFDVNYAEHNSSCVQGSFTPAINSLWSFINGSKTLTTQYNEVGVVDVNISDTAKICASRYARIDCDDANVSDGLRFTADLLPIGTTQAQIAIQPHHFDLNATLVNSGSGVFTYLSTDLNMSSKLDINATAKNEQNLTTLNYDKGCYAQTTTLNLNAYAINNSLTKILYHEDLSHIDGNVSKSGPISIPFAKTIFTQGLAPLSLLINFDRSRSQPINPFDFNLTSATLTDSNGTTGTTTPQGTAKYVYGRARAYDIKTDQPSAPNPIELEVYSSIPTGYVSGMPQNVLYWYRNLNYATFAQGSILSGDDYNTTTQTGTSSTITISPSLASPVGGLHNITITNPDAIAHAIVHLTIPSWLWYSPINNYDVSMGTKCTQHPCFDYQYFGTTATNITGVNSGTFQGSDFTLTPAKKNINKGVKVFR